MASWKWLEDGKSVEITTDSKEVKVYTGATIKEAEWLGFYDKIADEGEVHTILKNAKAAFVLGSADYSDARRNLKNLVREFGASSTAILEIAKEIGVFFSPTNLPESFGRNSGALVEFALEFVARTYVRGTDGR